MPRDPNAHKYADELLRKGMPHTWSKTNRHEKMLEKLAAITGFFTQGVPKSLVFACASNLLDGVLAMVSDEEIEAGRREAQTSDPDMVEENMEHFNNTLEIIKIRRAFLQKGIEKIRDRGDKN